MINWTRSLENLGKPYEVRAALYRLMLGRCLVLLYGDEIRSTGRSFGQSNLFFNWLISSFHLLCKSQVERKPDISEICEIFAKVEASIRNLRALMRDWGSLERVDSLKKAFGRSVFLCWWILRLS